MPNYRRAMMPGETFFFTLVAAGRRRFLIDDLARECLHAAIARVRTDHPFVLDAMVLLPEHLHLMMTLPSNDADFVRRVRMIKSRFTRSYLERGGTAGLPFRPTLKREARGERGIWQQRYFEHLIRDEDDLRRHVEYIHLNPVKHGVATCPHAWEYSSFARWVKCGAYEMDWGCGCHGGLKPVPIFAGLAGAEMD